MSSIAQESAIFRYVKKGVKWFIIALVLKCIIQERRVSGVVNCKHVVDHFRFHAKEPAWLRGLIS